MLPFRWLLRNGLRVVTVFGVSFALGITVWAAAPNVTGQVEPWNAEGWDYVKLLFAAGFIASLFSPRAFWIAPFGIAAGQVLCGYYFSSPSETMWPVTVALTSMYAVAALAGAIAGGLFMTLTNGTVSLLGYALGRSHKSQDIS